MAIRKTAQYSPFNAQVIEVDHFSAIAATDDPNELEYKIEVVLDLDSYSFPDDAELDLEVLSGENLFTADLGTVSFFHNPKETFIFDAKPNSIRMRLRVTPKDATHLIGYSKLRACYEGDLTSLMLVRPKPLGQATWIFEYETADTPILYLNEEKFKELQNFAVNDLSWQGQVLPQCIYSGYMHIATNNFEGTTPDDQGCWQFSWWTKAEELCPGSTSSIREDKTLEDYKNWAEELAKKFSLSAKYLNKFLAEKDKVQQI